MKKLFCIVLAVAMMATFCCFNASAAEKVSLLPASADDFTTIDGGDGSMTITKEGDGYKFSSTQGWPQAHYMGAEDTWVTVNVEDEAYLNYDFEVVSGATSVIVYFCGQNPGDQAGLGSYVSINGLIDPSLVDSVGTITDLGVGKYSGSVKVSDLGCREDLMVEGDFMISGVKVFAVGGDTIVNDLSVSIGAADNDVVDTDNTTAPKTTAADKDSDSKETGDATQAATFAVVALAAVAVVTLSVVASKKAKAR